MISPVTAFGFRRTSNLSAYLSLLAVFVVLRAAADQGTGKAGKDLGVPAAASSPLGARPFFFEEPDFVRRDPRKQQFSHDQIVDDELKKRRGTDPLFITPLLESGDFETARELSKVGFIVDGLQDSYAGYFTVNKEYGSNIFFWLFKAKNGNASAPLLLWLNGGPGSSSLLGLTLETGPLTFDPDTLEPQLPTYPGWTDDFDVVFIDQPVGTGYSFTEDPKGFAFTSEQYTADLFEAITQFFQLFPEYLEKDFYATGISYGGKYAPCLAERIHQFNQAPSGTKMPLTGIVTINGITDPATVFPDIGDFLYHHGLLDRTAREIVNEEVAVLLQAIAAEDWLTSASLIGQMADGDVGLLRNYSGWRQVFNTGDPEWSGIPTIPYARYPEFVNQPIIRDAIHVGSTPFGRGHDVQAYLALDLPRSARPKFETILDNGYKVLVINGAQDLILGPRTATAMLHEATWRYADEYKAANRELVNDEQGTVVGYLTKVRNLWQAAVLGGTHYAPANVPEPIYDILKQFIAADVN